MLKVVATIGLCALVLLRVDLSELRGIVATGVPERLLIALCLVPANLGLETIKWHRILRRAGHRPRLVQSTGSVLSGYSLGFVTPARAGEFVGRAYRLPQAGKLQIAGLTLVDRMTSLFWYFAGGLAATLVVAVGSPAIPIGITYVAVAVGCGGLAVLIGVLAWPAGVARSLGRVGRLPAANRVAEFLTRSAAADGFALFSLAAARYVVLVVQLSLLLLAFHPKALVAGVLGGACLILFVKAVVPAVTVGDLGIREASAVLLAGVMHVPVEAALAAALTLYAINIVAPSVAGIGAILIGRRSGSPLPVGLSNRES